MGKGLKFLGVPLLVFALLLLAGTSWARVVDFRAGVSSTTVQSGGKVYVVVELLNEDGQVDPFGYQEVQGLKVQTASLLGTPDNPSVSVNATHKGVVLVEIDYTGVAPGTDLIAVTVKESIYDEDGDLIERVIGTKRFNVEVQRPENTAKAVQVTSIALPETPIEDEAGGYTDGKCSLGNTSGTCVVEAGRSFIINLQACNATSTCGLVNSQNSEVKVWLVGTADKVEGNKALGTRYEFTGQFVGGVASITVPAGKITKAGKYKIYISAPSVYENTITGKNEAIEYADYYVEISPREAKKVVVKALDVDQTGKAWCWVNATGSGNSSEVMVYLADEYGNIADNETGLDDTDNTTTVRIKYDDKTMAEVDLGQQGVVSAEAYLDCAEKTDWDIDAQKRDDFTFTVELRKNDKGYTLENTSLDVNVYESILTLNDSAWSASDFIGTGNGAINSQPVDNLFASAANSTYNYNDATDALNKWVSVSGGDRQVMMHFEFYNGTVLMNEATVIVDNDTNGTITTGALTLQNLSKTMNKVCFYVETPSLKLPKVCTDLASALDLKNKALATDIKLFQLGSSRYVKDLFGHAFREVSKVELYAKDSANMTVYNGTGTDVYAVKTMTVNATDQDTKYFPAFAARLVDSAGNFVNDNVTVSCTKGEENVSGDKVIITWDDTTVTSDTCKIKSGVFEKEITVTLNWGAGPDHVKIDTPYDYVLTTSKVPVALSLRKKDGSLYRDDPGNYTILIDNPSLIRVFTDKTLTTEIHHGEEKIDWKEGVAQLFIQTLAAPGDVTITVQNAAGTVSGNLTLHIVESKADIPVVVGSVVASPTSLKLAAGAEGKVTVIVKDVTGNVVSGVEVSAASDNDAIASVTPATCETDAQGKCAFTVTAGSVEGTAHLTFTAQAQSATVDVQVSKVAPQPKNAAPEAAMEAKTLADWPFDPAAEITISGADRAMVVVQPMMQVPADMRGKTATLYYYITLPDGTPVTPEVVSLGEATLGETVTFDILTEAADLSSITGEFYIFVGFATQADFSDLVFNYYAVTLAE